MTHALRNCKAKRQVRYRAQDHRQDRGHVRYQGQGGSVDTSAVRRGEKITTMATPGRPLPHEILAGLRRLLREKVPQARAARALGISRTTVWKYKKKGPPQAESVREKSLFSCEGGNL